MIWTMVLAGIFILCNLIFLLLPPSFWVNVVEIVAFLIASAFYEEPWVISTMFLIIFAEIVSLWKVTSSGQLFSSTGVAKLLIYYLQINGLLNAGLLPTKLLSFSEKVQIIPRMGGLECYFPYFAENPEAFLYLQMVLPFLIFLVAGSMLCLKILINKKRRIIAATEETYLLGVQFSKVDGSSWVPLQRMSLYIFYFFDAYLAAHAFEVFHWETSSITSNRYIMM
jgi:hypothetical protein